MKRVEEQNKTTVRVEGRKEERGEHNSEQRQQEKSKVKGAEGGAF